MEYLKVTNNTFQDLQDSVVKEFGDLNSILWTGTWDCFGRRVLVENDEFEGVSDYVRYSSMKPFETSDYVIISKTAAKVLVSMIESAAMDSYRKLSDKEKKTYSQVVTNPDDPMNVIPVIFGGENAAYVELVKDCLNNKKYWTVYE